MVKLYYRKECEDCSTLMKYEALDELLDDLREILQVPEKGDIIKHARMIMKNRS